jgi:hypothetical protein
MYRTADDIPNFPLVRTVVVAIEREIRRQIAEHVATHHVSHPELPSVRAVPFPDQHIPDAECARILEAMGVDALTWEEAADRFNRPALLLEREVRAYHRRYRRWLDWYAPGATGAG